ncbi:hypothetical protein N7535_009255 [Penicillium sp. DV-2018c]|nr:hypothetical protein N7535_009255 [Penicillium sp. DV-2018c]
MPPLSKTGSVAAHQHDIRADVYRGLADDLAGAAMDAAAEGTEATMTGPAGQRRMWAVHASCRIYTRTLFPWSAIASWYIFCMKRGLPTGEEGSITR